MINLLYIAIIASFTYLGGYVGFILSLIVTYLIRYEQRKKENFK